MQKDRKVKSGVTGRPTIYKDMTVRSFKISQSHWDKLDRLASRRKVRKVEMLRQMIDEFYTQNNKPSK